MNRKTAMVPVTPEALQTIQSVAPIVKATRMYGVTEEQAAIIMLKGYELGLGLSTSFEFIDVIGGRPSLKPKGAIALIHQGGHLAAMEIEDIEGEGGDPVACRVYMERDNGFAYEVTFSMEDARRAGLIKPDGNWEKYPANMLRWRAIGYCADIVFPDAIGGLYRPEELGAEVDRSGAAVHDDGGVVLEGKATDGGASKADGNESSAEEGVAGEGQGVGPAIETLDGILDAGYSAEDILAANEGRIPATSEDCRRVFEELESESG